MADACTIKNIVQNQSSQDLTSCTLTQAPVPPKTCLSTLNMAALQSPKQSRNKELWSLINLGRALGSGRADNPLCPQERGAVAYQVQSQQN